MSNFSESPLIYDGITYQNAEAAFQAQKCIKKEDREKFSFSNSSDAKKMGRRVSLRPDWEKIKVKTMKNIVYEKFFQNEQLREKLLNTGNAYLDEGNTWGDRIWGTVDGKGANLLGKILMEVREEVKGEKLA